MTLTFLGSGAGAGIEESAIMADFACVLNFFGREPSRSHPEVSYAAGGFWG
jgi:hypothetical protein